MNNDLKLYLSLNALAHTGGCVIMGSADDRLIPLCELKEAFELQDRFYNRSFNVLCLDNAIQIYDQCVAPLKPQDLYLHIGENDLSLFSEDSADFDLKYTKLVQHISGIEPKCRIIIVGLKNPENDPLIARVNKHLEVIAQSNSCDFCDIAKQQIWNPLQTKDVVSFVYSIGFVRPLKQQRPVQDIVKILFCYDSTFTV